MAIEIKVPVIGESITEVTLTSWAKEDGDFVEEGEILCEIESDKATVELPAESSGILKRTVDEGSDLPIGAVIGSLDTEASGGNATPTPTASVTPAASSVTKPTGETIDIKVPVIGESITEVSLTSWAVEDGDFVNEGDILCEIESDKATVELPAESSGIITKKVEEGTDLPIGAIIATLAVSEGGAPEVTTSAQTAPQATTSSTPGGHPSPAAAKIMAEKGIDASTVSGTGKDGRITKGDALNANTSAPKTTTKIPAIPAAQPSAPAMLAGSREIKREKMTRLRKTIAKRLTEAKNTTAMLTTFNEVDMKPLMDMRKKYQDQFVKAHDVKLGFMSLFTKACCIAMQKHPLVNAQIDGDELVIPQYVDMGIAVSAPKGLVVPVLRNSEGMNLATIEKEIKRLAGKARDGKLSVDEMSGGTFTITNGGVFGSMLSTPILNIPQSAILGMHNIVERAWVVDGKIEIRPIMYIALSYDHRVIDGKDSVGFLKTVKELLEDPARMILDI
ncbi:MAG: 2-oxoglutarate dehydrogenase E2 component (dihydrolipoamide succinyltransferase) [Bacteriovoracaceae bacterium]|jgi:2-oxoglutarate dehydrogenase E2 component (dihydrolipoamide succinyltransferase)